MIIHTFEHLLPPRGIDDLYPSGPAGFDNTMSVDQIHTAAVIDDPHPEGKDQRIVAYGRGQTLGQSSVVQLREESGGQCGRFLHGPRGGSAVVL